MTDLSYEIAEVRALSAALLYMDRNACGSEEELFKNTSPYLIRLIDEKVIELERRYEKVGK